MNARTQYDVEWCVRGRRQRWCSPSPRGCKTAAYRIDLVAGEEGDEAADRYWWSLFGRGKPGPGWTSARPNESTSLPCSLIVKSCRVFLLLSVVGAIFRGCANEVAPPVLRARAGMATFGYARLTNDGLSLSEQTAQLEAAGCIQVFADKGSSAKLRPDELSRALSYLRQGDALIVTHLDRLARSTPNLSNVLQAIAQAGASVTSLGDPWINTAGTHGELILTILRGIADFETGLMKRGRARAKAKGVKLGRRLALTPAQCEEALQRVAAGESRRDVARSFAISATTISRVIRSAMPTMTAAVGFRRRIRQRRQFPPSSGQ